MAVVILPEVNYGDSNRVAMTCKFEKRYMGTIALTLDFGANNVEVARYQDTETAGVFHLNVISKTLVKWTRLPHKAFPKAFADTLVWAYGPGRSDYFDQVSFNLETGELTIVFEDNMGDASHLAGVLDRGALHEADVAQCEKS